MSFKAAFAHEAFRIDCTPNADVNPGDVVVEGNLVGVATSLIKANTKGALQITGAFDFVKVTSAGSGVAAGTQFYWDTSALAATPFINSHTVPLGQSEATCLDADASVRIVLEPNHKGVGLKMAYGQQTTVAASDTVVTGLTKVLIAVASLEDAPVIGCSQAQACIGDQAGTPAAGSVLIKTFKPTSNADPTPVAATTFTKKVNWVAWGY